MDDQVVKEIDFSVFVIHHLARSWDKRVPETFALLDKSGILNDYLVPCYDVLHTLGAEYLVDDLTELARERGVAV